MYLFSVFFKIYVDDFLVWDWGKMMRLVSRNWESGRFERFLFLHFWLYFVLVIIREVLFLSFECTNHRYFWLIMQRNSWRNWPFFKTVIILAVLSNYIVIKSSAFLFILWQIVAIIFVLVRMLILFGVLSFNFFLWFWLIVHLNLHLYLLTLISYRIRYCRSHFKLFLPFSEIYDFRFLIEGTDSGIGKVLTCSFFEKGFWLFDLGHQIKYIRKTIFQTNKSGELDI